MNIKTDPLVEKIAKRMLARSNAGIIKYGNTMRTAEKPLVEWIGDTQEELLDAIVYLEKVKEKISQ
jgi:hypothetical protein|tara:strand:- start:814 stop:1011 length:198 start_codon:yes stop_codon:yes gene_type:complete